MQQLIAQKGPNTVFLQQGKDSLNVIYTPPGVDLKMPTVQTTARPVPPTALSSSPANAVVSKPMNMTPSSSLHQQPTGPSGDAAAAVASSTSAALQSPVMKPVSQAPLTSSPPVLQQHLQLQQVKDGKSLVSKVDEVVDRNMQLVQQSEKQVNQAHAALEGSRVKKTEVLDIVKSPPLSTVSNTVNVQQQQLLTNKLSASPSMASSALKVGIKPSGKSVSPASSQQQQKIVLVNMNGQLLTQQGVPVTLSGGVIKPIGPAQVRVTSPKPVVTNTATPLRGNTVMAARPQVQTAAIVQKNPAVSSPLTFKSGTAQILQTSPLIQQQPMQLAPSPSKIQIKSPMANLQTVKVAQQHAALQPVAQPALQPQQPQPIKFQTAGTSRPQAVSVQQMQANSIPQIQMQPQQTAPVKIQQLPAAAATSGNVQQIRLQMAGQQPATINLPAAALQAIKPNSLGQLQVQLPAGMRLQSPIIASAAAPVINPPVQLQTGAGLVLQTATPGLVQLPGGLLATVQQPGQPLVVQQPSQMITPVTSAN